MIERGRHDELVARGGAYARLWDLHERWRREGLPILIELLSSGHAYDVFDAWSEERGCRVIVRTRRRRGDEGAGCCRAGSTHPNDRARVRDATATGRAGDAQRVHARRAAGARPRRPSSSAASSGSAVRYLHRNGVLHLDLKPDNLIAEGGRLKVIDFASRSRRGASARHRHRRWMAPEQLRGGEVGRPPTTCIGRVLAAAGGGDLVRDCLASIRGRPAVDPIERFDAAPVAARGSA